MRTIFALLTAFPAFAEPAIVTDIAPVHSLVSAVMQDIGRPTLLIEADGDPHHITLRPSQAGALAEADAVFWISPNLTPWLAKPVATLSGDAHTLALADVPGTKLNQLDGHEAVDPHVWLDPDNAVLWLPAIAAILGQIDPENADTYTANASSAAEGLQVLIADLSRQLSPLVGNRYLVTHDAYGYFSSRFGLHMTEAISDSDAAQPTAGRLAELRQSLAVETVICAFREPQQSPAALETLLAGTDTPVATLDPLGTNLDPGPLLYPDLLRAMADAVASCSD